MLHFKIDTKQIDGVIVCFVDDKFKQFITSNKVFRVRSSRCFFRNGGNESINLKIEADGAFNVRSSDLRPIPAKIVDKEGNMLMIQHDFFKPTRRRLHSYWSSNDILRPDGLRVGIEYTYGASYYRYYGAEVNELYK